MSSSKHGPKVLPGATRGFHYVLTALLHRTWLVHSTTPAALSFRDNSKRPEPSTSAVLSPLAAEAEF